MRTYQKQPPTAVYVGKRIKARREALGLEAGYVAGLLGISPEVLQLYEEGGGRMCLRVLRDLRVILSVDGEWFFHDV